MRKTLNQRRLDAYQEIASESGYHKGNLKLQDTFVGVLSIGDRQMYCEVPIHVDAFIDVHGNRGHVAGRRDPAYTDWGTQYLNFSDGLDSLYEEIETEYDANLADLIIENSLSAAESKLRTVKFPEDVDIDGLKSTAEGFVRSEIRKYAVSSSGYLYKTVAYPILSVEIAGDSKLLKSPSATINDGRIRVRISAATEIKDDLSQLLYFDVTERAAALKVIDWMKQQDRSTRLGEHDSLALSEGLRTPPISHVGGLLALAKFVGEEDTSRIETFCVKSALVTPDEALEALVEEVERLKEMSDPAVSDEVLRDNGWDLTVSPFDVALVRLKAMMSYEPEEAAKMGM